LAVSSLKKIQIFAVYVRTDEVDTQVYSFEVEIFRWLTLQKHFFGTTAVANDLCSTRKMYLGHRVKNCQVTIVLMKPVENFNFFVFFENSLLCMQGARPKVHHTCFSCFTSVSPLILKDTLVQLTKWSKNNVGFWRLLTPFPWQLVRSSHAITTNQPRSWASDDVFTTWFWQYF
jgi:hypothetical protein